jgi:hypothetical protein
MVENKRSLVSAPGVDATWGLRKDSEGEEAYTCGNSFLLKRKEKRRSEHSADLLGRTLRN